jgi:predicted kinase
LNEGVYDSGILKCIFLAGGPGSGKSYTANQIFGVGKGTFSSVSAGGLKTVNSDAAFEKALKDNGIDSKQLADIEKNEPELWDSITKGKTSIRGKAKQLTDKQQDFYEKGRLGMIIDGTGDNLDKIKDKKKHAESLGYDCYMIFVNTSLEVAHERNKTRDRVLPAELVDESWKACQNNLGGFQSMFGGNFIIVDNTEYKKYQSKFKNKKTGEIKFSDTSIAQNVQKSVDTFLSKSIQNSVGKKWITTQLMLKKANLIK